VATNHIPFAVIGTNAVNVLMTVVAVSKGTSVIDAMNVACIDANRRLYTRTLIVETA